MRKFFIKMLLTLFAAGGLLTWARADRSLDASAISLGLNDSLGWLAANAQDPKPFDLLEALQAGFLRVQLPWRQIEQAPGAISWSFQSKNGFVDYGLLFDRLEKRGIQPVVVLDTKSAYLASAYPNMPVSRADLLTSWTNFVRAAVEKFGDQVNYWQIGNSINDPSSWGSTLFPSSESALATPNAGLYAEMLKSASAIIRESQPGDQIVLGNLAMGGDCTFHPTIFLQSLSDMGAWFAFDIVDITLPTGLAGQPEQVQIESCGILPDSSTGIPIADAIRAIRNEVENAGSKAIWVSGLAFDNAFLNSSALVRGTLPEVVEADYLARASALLLANDTANKVFWNYLPQSLEPGALALQVYANTNRSLSGTRHSTNDVRLLDGVMAARFGGSGKLTIVAWRENGGDEVQPAIIQDVDGLRLSAWSADAPNLNKKSSVALKADSGGSTALMLSERPVIISGKPEAVEDAFYGLIKDSAAQTRSGIESRLANFVHAQKTKALYKVNGWVEKQQESLLQALKDNFNQWLRKSLGLA